MADALLQTLYWGSSPTFALTDISGSGASETRAITAAESHDASDTTYEGLLAPGDTAVEGNAYLDGEVAPTTASASGSISFIRVITRARVTVGGPGSASGSIQSRINGTLRGSPQALSASYVGYSEDFTTDPADAAAWTNAKLNAQTFGVRIAASSSDPDTSASARMPEFYVEVWGTSVQTATPVSAVITAVGGAMALVAGLSMLSCSAGEVVSSSGTTTLAPSAMTMTTEAAVIDTEASTVPENFTNIKTQGAESVPQAVFIDGDSTPVTLRVNTSPMYDQSLSTFASVSTPAAWPNSGERTINLGGFASTGITGTGGITGVIFFAYARIKKDTNVTVSAARIKVAGSYNADFTSLPPVGTYASPPSMALVQTALVTTSDGSTPWDWTTIFAALTSSRIAMVADAPSPAAIGQFAQLDVAEVWCEVHNGALPGPEEVVLRQRFNPSTLLHRVPSE